MSDIVFVEAEAFDDLGGWVVDQQFMDEMGSPYLLAHGLGRPVSDATTTVTFPAGGTYHVFVRTRDWVGPWKRPDTPETIRAEGTPGAFQVLVGDRALETVFGTEGAAWHWQPGGTVEIHGAETSVVLHDLTGFEGRCDAILFAKDPAFTPPDEGEALETLRRKALGLPEQPDDGGAFDLVVAGGGIAGMCAAVSAARRGLTVALLQDRPVLGGNNSSEVRVWLGGRTNFEPYLRIGDLVSEFEPERRAHAGPENTADLYEDDKRIALVLAEDNLTLLLNHRVNAVEMDGDGISAVVAQHLTTARRIRLRCELVADCTGHATVGALAGADFEMARSHMGRSNLWHVAETPVPVSFPRCPWALDLSDSPFPGRGDELGQFASGKGLDSLGLWYWESGFERDPILEGERIRDWNFRAMFGAWDCLKNVEKRYPNHALTWAAYVAGPRESRRLLGDVILTREDLLDARAFDDACVPTSWSIDLHHPDEKYKGRFEGDAFISRADMTRYDVPYWIPYRCLYSRNVGNLFAAGRDISVTHEALGAVRVMRTCGMMGEVVGLAASLCRKHDTTPRGVYRDYLEEFKERMRLGVGRRG